MIKMVLRLAQWGDVMPHLLCRQTVSGESSQTRFPITERSLPGLEQDEGRGCLWSGLQSRKRGGSWELPPASHPLQSQHQKAVAHLTPQCGWTGAQCASDCSASYVRIASTVTKDLPRSDFSSDVEMTVLALIELVGESTCIHTSCVWT